MKPYANSLSIGAKNCTKELEEVTMRSNLEFAKINVQKKNRDIANGWFEIFWGIKQTLILDYRQLLYNGNQTKHFLSLD